MTVVYKLLSEKQLIDRIISGNQKAFEILFRKYHPIVYSYYRNRLNSTDEISDLCQEVFIRIWKSKERIDPEKPFKTYLFTIARNILIDFFRKKQIETIELENHTETPTKPTVDSSDLREKIAQLIQGVSPAQQITYFLHRLDGFSYKEISESLGISEKTVGQRLAAVNKYLSNSLK